MEIKKYCPEDSSAHEGFVRDGYVIYKNVYPKELIDDTRELFFSSYNRLDQAHKEGKIDKVVNGWAISIINMYEKTQLYENFISNTNIIKVMKGYLGPDICVLGYDALWINAPKDKDPVLLKSQHTDAWTGTSINSIFVKSFITDVDQYNSMCVSPASHLQGLMPVRNREIDPMYKIKFENINLDCVVAGDVLIWHPLLIHSTMGHSDKNIRMSITSRFSSTESPFSSQERALGYRTLSVGPMNQVIRIVGNDQLQSLRSYGGFVGVDRRMRKVYGYSDFKTKQNYDQFLE